MTTKFGSIAAALVVALSVPTAVAASVDRARLRPTGQDQTTAAVVRLLDAEIEPSSGQGVASIWATRVAVELYARSSGASQTADQAVDALLEAAVNRLMSDRSLGGLVGDIGLLGLAYDFEGDGNAAACVTLTLNVRHATGASSIS